MFETYAYAFWWLIMGAFLISELLTGSFYLLMLAIAAALAAISAHLGVSISAQCLIATSVSLLAFVLCYLIKRQFKKNNPSPSFNLDVGAQIMVKQWQADGTAQVKYRGAKWTAICNSASAEAGLYKIVALNGNRLVLELI